MAHRQPATCARTSDIDLGILAQAPLIADFKLQLIQTIGAEFGRPVDIVDLYHAPEPVLGQVFKGIRLCGDNATYARLLIRHLLNVADFLPLHQRILTERRNRWINGSLQKKLNHCDIAFRVLRIR